MKTIETQASDGYYRGEEINCKPLKMVRDAPRIGRRNFCEMIPRFSGGELGRKYQDATRNQEPVTALRSVRGCCLNHCIGFRIDVDWGC